MKLNVLLLNLICLLFLETCSLCFITNIKNLNQNYLSYENFSKDRIKSGRINTEFNLGQKLINYDVMKSIEEKNLNNKLLAISKGKKKILDSFKEENFIELKSKNKEKTYNNSNTFSKFQTLLGLKNNQFNKPSINRKNSHDSKKQLKNKNFKGSNMSSINKYKKNINNNKFKNLGKKSKTFKICTLYINLIKFFNY